MKVTKQKQLAARRKAITHRRAVIGWTRTEWIDEVEVAISETFVIFCKAKLAERNRNRILARNWTSEFERELTRRMIDVAVHPVKQNFDRMEAFDEAIVEMENIIEKLCEHVGTEFVQATGKVQRGLGADNIEVFLKAVGKAARILTG
jgi:hypothetical protein